MGPIIVSQAFAEWNEGELESFLIEITSSILGMQPLLASGHACYMSAVPLTPCLFDL
jgi:hypothetical protein